MLFVAPLFFGSCAERQSFDNCNFSYTKRVLDEVIVPTMKEHDQKYYWLYDLKNPKLIEEANLIKLFFRQKSKTMDGGMFVIVLNPCSNSVMQAYETGPSYILEP